MRNKNFITMIDEMIENYSDFEDEDEEEPELTFEQLFDKILLELGIIPSEQQKLHMMKFCKMIHGHCWTAAFELEGRNASEEMKMICQTIYNDSKFIEFYQKNYRESRLFRELYRFYRHGITVIDGELVYQSLVETDGKANEELQFRYPGVRLIKSYAQNLAFPNNISPCEDERSPTPEERSQLISIYQQSVEEGIYDTLRTELKNYWQHQTKRSVNDVIRIYNEIKNQ